MLVLQKNAYSYTYLLVNTQNTPSIRLIHFLKRLTKKTTKKLVTRQNLT